MVKQLVFLYLWLYHENLTVTYKCLDYESREVCGKKKWLITGKQYV